MQFQSKVSFPPLITYKNNGNPVPPLISGKTLAQYFLSMGCHSDRVLPINSCIEFLHTIVKIVMENGAGVQKETLFSILKGYY